MAQLLSQGQEFVKLSWPSCILLLHGWPALVTLCCCFRFMTDAARREQESLKKKIQPKLSLTLSSSVSRGNVSTPPRHSSGSLTPPVTPPITPSSSFRSSTPTGEWLGPASGRDALGAGDRGCLRSDDYFDSFLASTECMDPFDLLLKKYL